MLIEIACLMVYFIFGLFENTFFYPFTSCAAVKYCSYSYSLLKYLSYFFYGICAIISTKIISALSLIFLDLVDSATNFYKKNKQ
ncbi:MAG: hypothetical protein LBT02_00380 [Rickettsiales bacterium]|nr:hypothetical protein [Rickettsiales bacterium]